MMSDHTFATVVRQVRELGVSRIRVTGNGEPTLHPKFASMIIELARACAYLQVVTNAQHLNEDMVRAILTAPVRMLEVSVDSKEKEGYERSRIGGHFETLLGNLRSLRILRDELKAPTVVNVRAMIRPSQRAEEHDIRHFWRAYSDTVMPQYVVDLTKGADRDVFGTRQRLDHPRCTLPFKGLGVHWNGIVPLCSNSTLQTGRPDGLVIGNVHETPLEELWRHPLMVQYRIGHRKRDTERTTICGGCPAQ
jgi:MoaA/NifB/PqqE/SkfB family radical SAM enzyme